MSVIDATAGKVVASISVDRNPNDLALAPDGRLFVACSNDNSVVVIDTKDRQIKERVSTALSPKSPPGSTPNALALDWANKLLYVANADNNDVAVVHIEEAGRSEVVGFIPTGWYPSAVAFDATRPLLYIGNSKGFQSFALIPDRVAPSPKGRGRSKTPRTCGGAVFRSWTSATSRRSWPPGPSRSTTTPRIKMNSSRKPKPQRSPR